MGMHGRLITFRASTIGSMPHSTSEGILQKTVGTLVVKRVCADRARTPALQKVIRDASVTEALPIRADSMGCRL
jgi:hypothetical protein